MHDHGQALSLEKKLKLGFIINTGFAVLELAAGLISGSLALISDAGHNLTDSLSLTVSFVAQKISRRRATPEHTYGFGKATIIAAFINSLILLLAALLIFYKAYQRITDPQAVDGGWIMGVAIIGILANTAVALLFRKDRHDLNIRSAYINMAFDVIASVGALLAGLIIYLTGQPLADPIISIIIGVMLVISSWGVMNDALHVLLEGVPETLDVKKVEELIKQHPNVRNVHDFHIWTISAKNPALMCHIVPREFSAEKNLQTVRQLKQELLEKFNIFHVTIETEQTECPPHEH